MKRSSIVGGLRAAAVSLAAVLLCAPAAAFDTPSAGAATASTVQLPSGPGSLQGLAASPGVSVFTGQVSESVPFPLPPGPGGFGPSLALTYNGALGNGPLGIGWSLTTPRIVRSLRHGVPTYVDSVGVGGTVEDELELEGVGNGGRLVRLPSGQLRVEGHGDSVRVIPIGSRPGYVVALPDGARYFLDVPWQDPLAVSGSRTAGWLVSEAVDVHGHSIRFETIFDEARPYLTGVTWGGVDALSEPPYRVSFGYEDRPDHTVSYRTGFRVGTYWRLGRLTLSKGGREVRRMTLGYEQTPPPPGDSSANKGLSRLVSVGVTGLDHTGVLPLTHFAYGGAWLPRKIGVDGRDGWALEQRGTTLADVDGDGLTDLLRLDLGERTWKRSHRDYFEPDRPLTGGTEAPLEVTRLMDITGDGVAELITSVSDEWHVLRFASAPPRYEAAPPVPGSTGLPLIGPDVAFADVDGDGRADYLQAKAGGVLIALMSRTATAAVGPRRMVGPLIPTLPAAEIGDVRTQLLDANGDGLADVVFWDDRALRVALGRGDGTFADPGRIDYPWGEAAFQVSDCRLEDLNRDGLLDLVRIGSSFVFAWTGHPGGFQRLPSATIPRPDGLAWDSVVTFADLNGNGSSDLVFTGSMVEADDGAGERLSAIDFVGTTTAALLTVTDNGLGARTTIDYASSTDMALEADGWGRVRTSQLPMAVPVPWRVTVHTGHPGDPDRVTAYRVSNGFWDSDERAFGGFTDALATTAADADRPMEAVVAETVFEPGHSLSRVLRGQPIFASVRDGAGRHLADTVTAWDALPIAGLDDSNPLLRVARAVGTVNLTFEGATNPVGHRTHTDFDSAARPVRVVDEGRDDLAGDERITETAYASNDATGVRDVPCGERLRALDGTVLRYSRSHYDQRPSLQSVQACDPTADALCTCSVTSGLAVAQDGWLGPVGPGVGRWVRLSETDYHAHGLPTRAKAGGVEHTLGYDEARLHPISESVPGAIGPLTWSLSWDSVLDQPSALTDPNGLTTRLVADSFGRPLEQWGPVRLPSESTASDRRLVRYTYYDASPTPNGPAVETERFEYGTAPDGRSIVATNGLGEPTVLATWVGHEGTTEGPWLISGYRFRNRLGLTTRFVQPFATEIDPRTAAIPPPDTTYPGEDLRYDALRRPIEHTLPVTPSLPEGVTETVTIGSYQTTTQRRWKYVDPAAAVPEPSAPYESAPVTTVTDGLGRTVHSERDVSGVVETRDTTYDAAGAITREALHGLDVVRTFSTDTLGRLRRADDPDTGLRQWTYDDDGRLTDAENAVGDAVTYAYDGAGRLVTRALTSAAHSELDAAFTFHYDVAPPGLCTDMPTTAQKSRLVATTTDVGPEDTTCVAYDLAGRLARTRRTLVGLRVETGLDTSPSGLVLRSTFQDGTGTERAALADTYDAAGRLLRIDGQHYVSGSAQPAAIPLWTVAGYDARGGPRAERFGNGIAVRYGRDLLGLVTSLWIGATGSAAALVGPGASPTAATTFEAALDNLAPEHVRFDLAVSFDGTGAPKDVHDLFAGGLLQDAHYDYDVAGRITGAVLLGTHLGFQYDALESLTSRTTSVPLPDVAVAFGTYAHGSPAHKRRLTQAGTLGLGYDAAGRVTQYGPRTLTFDADERLRAVVATGLPNGALRYAYGADGARSLTWHGAVDESPDERRFSDSLLHVDDHFELIVSLGDRPIARWRLPETDAGGPGELHYLHKGVAAGPVLITDEDGLVREERIYEPYGGLLRAERYDAVVMASSSAQLEPYGANNKPIDPDSLWSDHGARWMSAEIGQWLSSDPLSWQAPMAQLPYAYVGGRPTIMWDPDGKIDGPIDALIRLFEDVSSVNSSGNPWVHGIGGPQVEYEAQVTLASWQLAAEAAFVAGSFAAPSLGGIATWNMFGWTIGIQSLSDAVVNTAIAGGIVGVFRGIAAVRSFATDIHVNLTLEDLQFAEQFSGISDEAGVFGTAAPKASKAGVRFPDKPAQIEHIFRMASGHIADTPANRTLLQGVADDASTTLGTDKFGNLWSARTLDDGTQAWVQTRNGVIQNGGLNQTPRIFNPETGLSGP